ncbi:MAG: MFS transporter [bacterium]
MVEQIKKSSVLEGVTAYHWLVVLIASGGWLFDCMDQRIFALAREPALKELLQGNAEGLAKLKSFGGMATAAMIVGWATGGIIFGVMSDKFGRVKTMMATLLVYSGFTGLSGYAHSWQEFMVYRFLVGLGVGGMFGAATTLVAESVPAGFRTVALGSLQALSATGNIMGSLISTKIQPGAPEFLFGLSGWRILFFVGILPALLIIPIVFVLREPEPWIKAKEASRRGDVNQKPVGSMSDLFRNPRWRYHSIIGMFLGLAGMAGLWGVGFFSPELISTALKGEPQHLVDSVRGNATALQDCGSFFGMFAFTFFAARWGRKPTFLISFILSLGVTIYVFNNLNSAWDAFWMLPLMGFAQLSVFAGYSIYFPELYPTRLRGTGVGFCYNTVRYISAPFPWLMGALADWLLLAGYENPFRLACSIVAFIYVVGIIAITFAPETKGQPLPED